MHKDVLRPFKLNVLILVVCGVFWLGSMTLTACKHRMSSSDIRSTEAIDLKMTYQDYVDIKALQTELLQKFKIKLVYPDHVWKPELQEGVDANDVIPAPVNASQLSAYRIYSRTLPNSSSWKNTLGFLKSRFAYARANALPDLKTNEPDFNHYDENTDILVVQAQSEVLFNLVLYGDDTETKDWAFKLDKYEGYFATEISSSASDPNFPLPAEITSEIEASIQTEVLRQILQKKSNPRLKFIFHFEDKEFSEQDKFTAFYNLLTYRASDIELPLDMIVLTSPGHSNSETSLCHSTDRNNLKQETVIQNVGGYAKQLWALGPGVLIRLNPQDIGELKKIAIGRSKVKNFDVPCSLLTNLEKSVARAK
jgi:hypothetical protein